MTDAGATLRLVWPQWQGADPRIVEMLTPELDTSDAQLGYHLGATLIDWLMPTGGGPTVTVPVSMERRGLATEDGIFARAVVLDQLRSAVDLIATHDPQRIVTIGGECSVSVAPFAHLAAQYGDDLAVVWIDAHPDTGMPEAASNDGYHSMAVSHLTGHGDQAVLDALPAVVDPARVALVGLHSWEDDQEPFTTGWGLTTFAPADVAARPAAVLEWVRATGCSKVAIHWDVDSVDSDEMVLGLGMEPGGLSRATVTKLVRDLSAEVDVVGLTVAEFLPRQVIAMRHLLSQMPLIGDGPGTT